jgi:hypothetical protein
MRFSYIAPNQKQAYAERPEKGFAGTAAIAQNLSVRLAGEDDKLG